MALAGWLFIGIMVFIALAVVFKFQDVIFIFGLIRKYLFVITMMSLILFLAFSLNYIHKNYTIDLSTVKGWGDVGGIYLSWTKSLVSNLGSVTGYISKQDWSLNSTKIIGK